MQYNPFNNFFFNIYIEEKEERGEEAEKINSDPRTRDVIDFTFPRTKISLSRNSFPTSRGKVLCGNMPPLTS